MKHSWRILVAVFVYTTISVSTPAQTAIGIPADENSVQTESEATFQRHQLLMTHGIQPTPASMLLLFTRGFPMDQMPKGLPQEPALKMEVFNTAIEELAEQRSEVAVPLLINIVKGQFPSQMDAVITRDFEGLPIDVLDQYIRTAELVFKENAIVALGHIGNDEAAPTILEYIRKTESPATKIRGAVALGQMGDRRGLEEVFALTRSEYPYIVQQAFLAVYTLTGRNYGVTQNTSIARREQLVKQANDWYLRDGDSIPVNRLDVTRRSANPPPSNTLDAASLRGKLRNTFNADDFDLRFSARQDLMANAKNHVNELEQIIQDPMEDLDIRRASMYWYSIADPKKARGVIRKQRSDENPIIAESAEIIVKEEIPRIIEAQEKGEKLQ